jgi:hypothetical protein
MLAEGEGVVAKLKPIELDVNVRVTITPVPEPPPLAFVCRVCDEWATGGPGVKVCAACEATPYCPCDKRCHTEDHPCSFDCLGHRAAGWMAAP